MRFLISCNETYAHLTPEPSPLIALSDAYTSWRESSINQIYAQHEH